MMKAKTKIVLDADVIIHFIKGGHLSLLLNIFPEYQYLILDVVYEEVTINKATKTQIDNTIAFMPKRVSCVKFAPKGESRMEYARLRSSMLLGKGESACMIYCKDNQDVLGSSNLKDISRYCIEHHVTYLTTIDFLYYAFIRKLMTKVDVEIFIEDVIANGSKLPVVDIERYTPTAMI
ncbi:MAG: hypothetical protein K2K94_03720 [Muribaculaceae bacterium]|nr:hypothetical protein [Muribaculaceae bacterium]